MPPPPIPSEWPPWGRPRHRCRSLCNNRDRSPTSPVSSFRVMQRSGQKRLQVSQDSQVLKPRQRRASSNGLLLRQTSLHRSETRLSFLEGKGLPSSETAPGSFHMPSPFSIPSQNSNPCLPNKCLKLKSSIRKSSGVRALEVKPLTLINLRLISFSQSSVLRPQSLKAMYPMRYTVQDRY